jgi:hypothetical protein
MDEKRIARLFGLTLGGWFAISLILSAITIESGMIPSACDADASLRPMQSVLHAGAAAFPRSFPPRKAPEEAR